MRIIWRSMASGFPAVSVKQATRGLSKSRNFHEGRDPFLRRVLAAAAQNLARDTGHDPNDEDYCQDLIASLVEDANVRRELNLMWLPTTAERVVDKLLTDEPTLRAAAGSVLTEAEWRLLLREPHAPWTRDDIPLLDEAAHALGPWSRPTAVETEPSGYRELRAEDAYRVTPHRDDQPRSTLAERALDDREWVYGHVIVDEAQELSAMAWRAIARRATRKSMTVVGDLQQASHPAAARDWDAALGWANDRLERHTLTVTYRITTQIAEAATELLRRAGGTPPALTPIRDGAPVTRVRLSLDELAEYAKAVARPHGRSALIVADEMFSSIREYLSDDHFGFDNAALDAPIAVVTAQQSKGLEFDCVIVVAPHLLSEQRALGADIYVASTRATQELHLVTLPDGDHSLA
jgi:nucleotide-binding universal stress UspA family protein